ncbi:MAG: methylated-DNA--[protein]-cysteine S-methyltransferase [Gammaproteobacteria bacterium]|nr:MAG: methylated-DNA--[protein]-cysteine S-methyltransferase [Gammaproteobacteria bacterium]
MNKINIQFYKTKYAEFILGSFDNQLCMLDYRYRKSRDAVDTRIKRGLGAEFTEQDDDVLNLARTQIDEYFSGARKEFNLPLLTVGTEFQKLVWDALVKIPYGTTSTYLQLARQISNEKAVRAVAAANGANSMSIIIPCHRIIGSDGDLTGYAGGLPVKKRLLQLEGCLLDSRQSDLLFS